MFWYNRPARLMIKSIKFDAALLEIPQIGLKTKVNFIAKKYISLITNILFKKKSKHPNLIKLFGDNYRYADPLGVAFLQSVFVDNSFLANYCPSPSVVVDIGANIGQFNFFCKNFLHASSVLSFEPIEESFKILSLNTKGKDIFPFAILSSSTTNLYIPNDINYMASAFKLSDSFRVEKVSGKKLDKIDKIKNLSKIDLLKIDTEGTELDVLKTCPKTLKKTKYVLIECSLDRPNSGDITDVCEFLYHANKFKIVHIGRSYLTKSGSIGAIDILFSS